MSRGSDAAANANYATNAGYASSANYANSAGYAPSTGLGDGQSWRYIGAAGCYWNSQGRTISVSSYMSQGGGGRNLYITVNGLDVGANMAGYTYMDRLTVSTIVPANSGFCIHASSPGTTVTYALM